MPPPLPSRLWIPRDPAQSPGLLGPILCLMLSFIIFLGAAALGAITAFAVKIGPDINGGNAILSHRCLLTALVSGITLLISLIWLIRNGTRRSARPPRTPPGT